MGAHRGPELEVRQRAQASGLSGPLAVIDGDVPRLLKVAAAAASAAVQDMGDALTRVLACLPALTGKVAVAAVVGILDDISARVAADDLDDAVERIAREEVLLRLDLLTVCYYRALDVARGDLPGPDAHEVAVNTVRLLQQRDDVGSADAFVDRVSSALTELHPQLPELRGRAGRVARKFVLRPDAEDVAGFVMQQLLRHADDLDLTEPIEKWVHTVAFRAAQTTISRGTFSRAVPLDASVSPGEPTLGETLAAPGSGTGEQAADRLDTLQRLVQLQDEEDRALDALVRAGTNERHLFMVRRALRDMSYAAIHEEYTHEYPDHPVDAGTVGTIIARARRRLRKLGRFPCTVARLERHRRPVRSDDAAA